MKIVKIVLCKLGKKEIEKYLKYKKNKYIKSNKINKSEKIKFCFNYPKIY